MVAAVLIVLGLVLALFALALLLGWIFSGPRYRGPQSAHFDGRRFRNFAPVQHASPSDLLRWQMHREKGAWKEWVDIPPAPPPPRTVGPDELRVTVVNHATVLLQTGGLNILTDPVWSLRASPVSWVGPKRHKPPGLRFEELPPIHAVLLSHNHYDHLDLPTLRRLAREHDPQFIVSLGNAALLRKHRIRRVAERDWWDEHMLDGLHVIAVPAQHFSSRGLGDRDATLWTGWMLAGSGGRIYFAGDTGLGPHIHEIAKRFSPLRLALLPIGAFRPRWFMKSVHMSPEDAVRAHITLRAATSIAIHHGTFFLGDDGQEEPAEELRRVLAEARGARFLILENGESCEA